MTAGLPLKKSVLTPLTKHVVGLVGLSAGMSVTFAAILKKKQKIWIRSSFGLSFTYNNINNFEGRTELYYENSKK